MQPPPFVTDPRDGPNISEAEFEEVMGRNRSVSSSAIARAVADASTGKFKNPVFQTFCFITNHTNANRSKNYFIFICLFLNH